MRFYRATLCAMRLAFLPLFLLTANAQQAVSVSFNQYPTGAAGMAITAGPEDALWFPGFGFIHGTVGDGIWQITTSGVSTDVGGPGGAGQYVGGITAGSDGALWFAYGNEIGRMTTAGSTTYYNIPSGGSSVDITAGPDGALWFTEYATAAVSDAVTGSAIGRITTSGVVTEYPLSNVSAAPQGIIAGPDGALWFTEQYTGKIGRITTSGASIVEYPVTTSGDQMYGIAAGADNALWFIEYSSSRIGRISTAGVVTEYPVATAGIGQSIAAGPDGALWFTNSTNIGRITTTGSITEYPVPSGAYSLDITAGPDGNMWFTACQGEDGVGPYCSSSVDQIVILTNPTQPPTLGIAKTHGTEIFYQGQSGTYTVTVSNQQAAAPSSGLVTVVEMPPSGITIVAMAGAGAGTGWNCSGTSCTRSDVLAGGSAYPAITVTVNVAANASSPLVNSVMVVGGGSISASASDSTAITAAAPPPPPLLSITKSHTGDFAQGQANAVYTITVSNQSATNPTFGAVTVTDTLPSGLTLVSMAGPSPGAGWTCSGNSCTRSDVLAAGQAYPPILVTVNVAANASSPQVNLASVSGGGNASSVGIADSTTIDPLFFNGEISLGGAVYYLTFPNGTLFGYYGYLGSGWIYHFDLGYEYVLPSGDANGDVYLYDLQSGHWWFTGPTLFPNLYDFTLAEWIYYVPNASEPGHYTTNPRQFASDTTHVVFTM
jgi:uncharacterized repeat protein (TIGR01451 family)